jgi:hypothetical protein
MLEGEEQEGKKESGRARKRERKRAKQGVIDTVKHPVTQSVTPCLGVCLLLLLRCLRVFEDNGSMKQYADSILRFLLGVSIVSLHPLFTNAQLTQEQCLSSATIDNGYCGTSSMFSYLNCFCCQGYGRVIETWPDTQLIEYYCSSCDSGKYMDAQQHKINSCKDCPLGTYQRNTKQSSCQTCPAQSTTIEPASQEYFISMFL